MQMVKTLNLQYLMTLTQEVKRFVKNEGETEKESYKL